MRFSLFKALLLLLSVMGLTACYPIYKTLQPEVDVIVQDEQGQLLDQVPVVLMREPNIGLGYRYTLAQTEQGKVHFDQLSEWRVEFLMIHGAVHYDWYLCIAQPGYETQSSIPVKQEQIKVTFKKVSSKPKPLDPNIITTSVDRCDQLPLYEINQANQRE